MISLSDKSAYQEWFKFNRAITKDEANRVVAEKTQLVVEALSTFSSLGNSDGLADVRVDIINRYLNNIGINYVIYKFGDIYKLPAAAILGIYDEYLREQLKASPNMYSRGDIVRISGRITGFGSATVYPEYIVKERNDMRVTVLDIESFNIEEVDVGLIIPTGRKNATFVSDR